MSKQQMLLYIVLVMIVIIGILGFLIYKKGPVHQATNEPTTAPTMLLSATVVPTTNPKILSNVLHLGKTQTCTVTDSNGTTQTYYMNGDDVRAEFITSNANAKVELLADGSQVYIWNNSENKGISIDELDTDTINSVMQAHALTGFDINAKQDLHCDKWTANPAVLAAPYTVAFTPVKK